MEARAWARRAKTTRRRRGRTGRSDRLDAIRLRFAISSHLDDQGITEPAAIGAAIGLPPAEAVSLLRRSQWRAGDVAALRQAAARLGLAEDPSGRWVVVPFLEDGRDQPSSQTRDDL